MSAEIKPKIEYQSAADLKAKKKKKGNNANAESENQTNSMAVNCKPKVDTEITCLISIYDSEVKLSNYLNEHPRVKNPCFLAVGWDKKLHIWDDPALKNDNGPDGEEERPFTCIDLPHEG